MTIAWVTDNSVCQNVMRHVARTGIEVKHIREFHDHPPQPSIFYGILRGAGRAMHILKYHDVPYWYIDNGYTDAQYIDDQRVKEMDGTYRIVRDDMIEPYRGAERGVVEIAKKLALIIPPSVYSANHYDTLPEDWGAGWVHKLEQDGYQVMRRDKNCKIPLEDQINEAGLVLAFNSMAVMKACQMGVPAYDTHGVFRNADRIGEAPPSWGELLAYYEKRQMYLRDFYAGIMPWEEWR